MLSISDAPIDDGDAGCEWKWRRKSNRIDAALGWRGLLSGENCSINGAYWTQPKRWSILCWITMELQGGMTWAESAVTLTHDPHT